MARRITEKGRQLQGRGKGTGANYKPWIKIREYNSSGTAVSFPDWKHGRMIQLLSQAELWAYIALRWDDEITDIREQYPLPYEDTNEIAYKLGIRPFSKGESKMTTNLVATWKDGHITAYAIESNRENLKKHRRCIERLLIEYHFWLSKGVRWEILYKEDFNPTYIRNIRDVVACYDKNRIFDEIGLIRHLIAHKLINVDLNKQLDYISILNEIKGDNTWNSYYYILEANSEIRMD